MYRFGFWDGLAIGLVAALGATAAHEIVTLLSTTVGTHWVVPAIIFAAFAGPAVAVAMWRRQLREPDTGLVKGWAAGLGLGLGLALGPIIAPVAAYSQALPRTIRARRPWASSRSGSPAVVIFTPFPVWVGHWADAWQQGGDTTARAFPPGAPWWPPRPPRGLSWPSACTCCWRISPTSSINPVRRTNGTGFRNMLRGTAIVIAQAWSGWVVCLLVVGMPLAAAVAYWRWRRPGHTADATVRTPLAGPGLVGSGRVPGHDRADAGGQRARARARRRSRPVEPRLLTGLGFFEEQAIVVIAAVCALITAARVRSAVGVALSVAVGAAVAAVGGLAMPNVLEHGRLLRIAQRRVRPSAGGGCLTSPDTLALRTVVLGAALVSILFVPAAHAAGIGLRRRIRRERRPAASRRSGGSRPP